MDDLSELIPFGAELGELLVREALKSLMRPAISYGKAVVGVSGDLEHAAAISDPRMGKPHARRDWRRPGHHSVQREIGAVGCGIDIPLGHKDDVWSFDEIDTISATT